MCAIKPVQSSTEDNAFVNDTIGFYPEGRNHTYYCVQYNNSISHPLL